MKEQIIAMRRAGRSTEEITAFTGANLSTVKTICRRNNVVPITYIQCLECGADTGPGRKAQTQKVLL